MRRLENQSIPFQKSSLYFFWRKEKRGTKSSLPNFKVTTGYFCALKASDHEQTKENSFSGVISRTAVGAPPRRWHPSFVYFVVVFSVLSVCFCGVDGTTCCHLFSRCRGTPSSSQAEDAVCNGRACRGDWDFEGRVTVGFFFPLDWSDLLRGSAIGTTSRIQNPSFSPESTRV